MANSIDNFIKLANFYNYMTTVMAAICVQKGGIPIENYPGRFFAADVLEFITEYGNKMESDKSIVISDEVLAVINKFRDEYSRVRELTTPTQKPIFEMTLPEFEKLMNI